MATQNIIRRQSQRGSAMVSVMLLLIALMTVGLLVMQSANRELSESGAMVARERATMSAHAAVQLAGALYRQQVAQDPSAVEALLATALAQEPDMETAALAFICFTLGALAAALILYFTPGKRRKTKAS